MKLVRHVANCIVDFELCHHVDAESLLGVSNEEAITITSVLANPVLDPAKGLSSSTATATTRSQALAAPYRFSDRVWRVAGLLLRVRVVLAAALLAMPRT
jgi:hypothetical protein